MKPEHESLGQPIEAMPKRGRARRQMRPDDPIFQETEGKARGPDKPRYIRNTTGTLHHNNVSPPILLSPDLYTSSPPSFGSKRAGHHYKYYHCCYCY